MRKIALLSFVCLFVVGYTAAYAATTSIPFSQVGTADALETVIVHNTGAASVTYTITFFAKSSSPGAVGTSVGSTSRTVVAGGNWALSGAQLAAGSGVISTDFQGYATVSDGTTTAGGLTDTKLWGAVFFVGTGLIAGFPLSDINP